MVGLVIVDMLLFWNWNSCNVRRSVQQSQSCCAVFTLLAGMSAHRKWGGLSREQAKNKHVAVTTRVWKHKDCFRWKDRSTTLSQEEERKRGHLSKAEIADFCGCR